MGVLASSNSLTAGRPSRAAGSARRATYTARWPPSHRTAPAAACRWQAGLGVMGQAGANWRRLWRRSATTPVLFALR